MNIDVKALADLLRTSNESDSEDDSPKKTGTASAMGPGDVGPAKKRTPDSADSVKKTKEQTAKEIWDEDEVADGAEFDDIYDTRQQPEYDIIYKQAVTSEDMFLRMSNKTPATASCENMIVKITLPDTKYSDVTLDVKDKFLDCRTPKFKLGLHLPQPVDSKNGRAQWDGDQSLLTVTLAMKREYDFMNF